MDQLKKTLKIVSKKIPLKNGCEAKEQNLKDLYSHIQIAKGYLACLGPARCLSISRFRSSQGLAHFRMLLQEVMEELYTMEEILDDPSKLAPQPENT
jgi:hypothetical protein